MTRVLILWASPTSTNLGVRALVEGTAALVHRVAPTADIVAQSYGQGPAPANIGVERTLVRELALDSRGLRSWLKSFDLVVDTRAGDSFADIYGLARLRQICAMAEFVRECHVPLVMGPQTIGPFNSRRGRWLGRWSLRRADRVIARDSQSAAAAQQLGRPVDLLSTDVVFALDQPEATGAFDVLLNVSGLLWNSNDHGSSDAYRRTVRHLIREVVEGGRHVTLISHVLDSANPDNDVPAAKELQREFTLDHVVPGSLEELRSTAKGANLMVGSRMHACLNSLSVGTPAIPLAYSRKFAPLLGDLGWTHVVDLKASADPAAGVLAIVNSGKDLRPDVARLRIAADQLLVGAEVMLGEFL